MTKNLLAILLVSIVILGKAQHADSITFTHNGKMVYGTFTVPAGTGPFPTIIINPGSGAVDRDGTVPLVGGNAACLYPSLVNDTLRSYKELSDALVDSGFAVLRYDKLEYTYPSTLGTITFYKLWLPVESAIGYVKTRSDVDTTQIILIGHSEGSSLIPYIAKDRTDIKALISLAGARTPFDSILAYQLVNVAQTCGGNVSQAQSQANQILSYFNTIRTNTWNGGTPTLFGAPASTWYDYVRATDSVAVHYNEDNLPTLFVGMGLDINVPPSELVRFQNDITIPADFWSMPGLIHYMTPDNYAHVSEALSDTIVYWLRHHATTTNILSTGNSSEAIHINPNPFTSEFSISMELKKVKGLNLQIQNIWGEKLIEYRAVAIENGVNKKFDMSGFPSGVYLVQITADGLSTTRKIIKQ